MKSNSTRRRVDICALRRHGLPRMDTMKLLLASTAALLLGALIFSLNIMNHDVKNAPPEEIAKLKSQVEQLQKEQERLQLEKQLQQLKATAPVSAPIPSASAAEVDELKAQLDALKKENADKANEQTAKANKKAAQDEEGIIEQANVEKNDSELRRARQISNALLLGRVNNVDRLKDGGFLIFDVLMPEQVQPNAELAIRRKTGILCRLRVSQVSPEGAIADILPGFGPIEPKVGDEVIFPPDY